jgi:hypothetical protein
MRPVERDAMMRFIACDVVLRAMPRSVLALLAIIAVFVATPAQARRAAARPTRCSRVHSQLVAADAQAQVYRRPEEPSGVPEYGYWGCVRGGRRSFLLGRPQRECSASGCTALERVTLTRTVVAYETYWSTMGGGGEVFRSEWHVVVLDLRSGRVLHRVPTGVTYPPDSRFVGDGPTWAIAVKGDGAVAWINDTVQHENRYQVHALDKNGERVLATGSDIAPGSLALAGSTLYWTQGGKPFSARLQ